MSKNKSITNLKTLEAQSNKLKEKLTQKLNALDKKASPPKPASDKYPILDLKLDEKELIQHSYTHFKDTYLYVTNTLYKYTNNYWQKSSTKHLASDIFLQILTKAYYRTKGNQKLMYPATARLAESIARILTPLFQYTSNNGSISATPFHQNNHLIPFKNYLLSTDNRSARPHDADAYQTSLLDYNHSPTALCHKFLEFLRTIIIDENSKTDYKLIDFLQEYFGYLLSPIADRQIFCFFHGYGENGKSVLLDIVESVLGVERVCYPDLHTLTTEKAEQQCAYMIGKRLAIFSEISTKNVLATNMLKKLASGDSVTCRHLYQETFSARYHGKIIIVGNNLPNVTDQSHGFWRRMKLIPFNYQIPATKRIDNYAETFHDELPGIFNWFHEGLDRLRQRGWTSVQAITDASAEYHSSTDIVRQFMDEHIISSQGDFVSSIAIYHRYKEFHLNSVGAYPLSQRALTEQLKPILHQSPIQKQSNNVRQRGWNNVKLSLPDGSLLI